MDEPIFLSHPDFGLIPAALITGDTARHRLQEAVESGFDLLHKPLEPLLLKATLRPMLAAGLPIPRS